MPVIRYTIFEEALIHFEGSSLPSEASFSSFTMKGDTLAEDYRHVFQISRPIVKTPAEDSKREARQFEIVLFVYDEANDKVTWMTHGNTGGDNDGSRNPFPEAAWALHHELPLLVWLLPGHQLRLSNVESHKSPITIVGKSYSTVKVIIDARS
ncbi:hypothetical protein VE02_07573 [Pseudogymnoascus sp. 03VT05]|nr:hypothetical protein VE02_07573 [Pseudogymnoascus sp. 03VT05]